VELFHLVSAELPDFDLERYVRYGGLPAAYKAENPMPRLVTYVQTYRSIPWTSNSLHESRKKEWRLP